MKRTSIRGILSLVLILGGCAVENIQSVTTAKKMTTSSVENPFYSESDLYMKYPPFDRIKNEHYQPAFKIGMTKHMAEIEIIAYNTEIPTFENSKKKLTYLDKGLDEIVNHLKKK